MIPKFRAWDKELQCWCPYRIYSLNELGDDVVEFMYVAQEVWFTNKESDNNFILMQSTGLEDKNGVEIYEGDYLSLISFEAKKEFKGEVVFSEGSFCVVVILKGHDYKVPLHELSNSNFLIEVLGNIYENPELLEVAE